MSDDPRAERRWRVPYVVLWPFYHADFYETFAEDPSEAKRKVGALLDRRCTLPSDWRFEGDPELVSR